MDATCTLSGRRYICWMILAVTQRTVVSMPKNMSLSVADADIHVTANVHVTGAYTDVYDTYRIAVAVSLLKIT